MVERGVGGLLEATQNVMSMRVVRALVSAAEKAGAQRAPLLAAVPLAPTALEEVDTGISFAQTYGLLDAIIKQTGDPAFGLHCMGLLGPGAFNPVTALVFHAPDLRQSMTSLQRGLCLLASGVTIKLEEVGRTATIRCPSLPGASPVVQRFAAEMMVLGLRRRVALFRSGAHFERICFAHPAPTYREEYDRTFKQQVSFGEPFSGLVFDREFLDARSPQGDAELHSELASFSERKIRQLARGASYEDRVRRVVLRHASPRHADMKSVARELQLSERSLRRRLAEEGKTFAQVTEEALASAAKAFLRERQLSIHETAFALGFLDRAAFHRAFRRWTGTTPLGFCQQDQEP
ncbi:MAG: AraC family transcriptional regulator ligand-binding domain-containing protein [Myxococcales bacterium]|nr:AraC family transcriptional regulator ligand-binding domain-containing protein [Myxococcales bacterium]MDD9969820.1 AraC family transcriptional regulator ligand-binding domain-containing protein [Myxococcales bacterium]